MPHAIIGIFQYISTYCRDLRRRRVGSILTCLVSGRETILAGRYYCDSNQLALDGLRHFINISAQNCLVGSRGVAGASKRQPIWICSEIMKQLLTGCIRDMQLFAKLAVNGMSRPADNVTEVSCPEFHSEMIRHYLKLDQPYLTLDESKNKEIATKHRPAVRVTWGSI